MAVSKAGDLNTDTAHHRREIRIRNATDHAGAGRTASEQEPSRIARSLPSGRPKAECFGVARHDRSRSA